MEPAAAIRTPALQDTVESAYRVFAGYRRGTWLNVCHCNVCLSAENEKVLLSTPLRQISADLLSRFTDAVSGGKVEDLANDMRFFLPRYFDLIARGEPPDDMGLDICLRRLMDFGWRANWPRAEVNVIDAFFDAYLLDCLQRLELSRLQTEWRLAFDLGEALTMMATAGGDMDRILRQWDSARDPEAALHMAAQRMNLASNPPRLINAYLSNEFDVAAEKIGSFLARPEVDARLTDAFFSATDARLQNILSQAVWCT
jgi:hypothetical protein